MSPEVGFSLGLPEVVRIKSEVEEITFRCSVCERTFSRIGFLKAHFQRTHPDSTFPSELYSKPTSETVKQESSPAIFIKSEPSLVREVAKSEVVSEDGEMPFRCYVCERTFSRIGFLKAHFQRAHPDSTFPFELYSKSKSETVKRKSNSAIFTKSESSLVCEVCKKSFAKKIDLLKHNFVHYRYFKTEFSPSASQSRSCDICNSYFSSRIQFRQHYFRCQLCSAGHCKTWLLQKEACNKENCVVCEGELCEKCHQLHLTSEVEEKTFSCVVCDRSFVGKRKLNDHYAIVHSITKLTF